MSNKGMEVHFIGGKYSGKKGWLYLNGKEPKEGTINVIVNLGRTKGEKITFVNESNWAPDNVKEPTCYAEAVIQQCPDLESALTELCRDFATCDMQQDPAGFLAIIEKKMNEEAISLESKGSKARYRRIKFVPPPGDLAHKRRKSKNT
jgi:hypothetical protein